MNYTDYQIQQLKEKGISIDQVNEQIDRFKKGFPKLDLDRPATLNDGINKHNDQEQAEYIYKYEQLGENLEKVNFIPASGAATRMFKFLHEFLHSYNPEEISLNAYINTTKSDQLFTFLVALEKFPFYRDIEQELKAQNPIYEGLKKYQQQLEFIKFLLSENGANYASKPKGLIPFHDYGSYVRTAFEEHLSETAGYASVNDQVKLHFTVSPNHHKDFLDELEAIKDHIERRVQKKLVVDFSFQDTATDTVAVNLNNQPILDDKGGLFFRPAGHGALLKNLNAIDADLIFIKNIDNVTTTAMHQESAYFKKYLAGIAVTYKKQIDSYLNQLLNGTITDISHIVDFLESSIGTALPKDFSKYSFQNQIETLIDCLNRPLRVCGMVKNEGEPGGGPFWVKSSYGINLQIVESAQVNKENEKQKNIAKECTHFNPVDIVCCVRDYKGDKFDLQKYCDPEMGFITLKSRFGFKLKAQELPGLWNGSMAYWNTIFVEVPVSTFNPVKTVNDLLKPAHLR